MLFFTSLCQSLCLRTYACTDLLSTICHVLCSVSYVLCYIAYICMTYFTLITTIRKENPDVHTEGRSFSVWRVNGQVPPKQSCFLSHRSISQFLVVSQRRGNKNTHLPCIVTMPAPTDSRRRRVLLDSVYRSVCISIHIYIYTQSLQLGFTVTNALPHDL